MKEVTIERLKEVMNRDIILDTHYYGGVAKDLQFNPSSLQYKVRIFDVDHKEESVCRFNNPSDALLAYNER